MRVIAAEPTNLQSALKTLKVKTMQKPEIYISKNHSKKLFSIVVPVYNVQDWLPKCLESIENQTCDDFELILVDDGATDNSGNLCQEYAENHDNVTVIHKPNGGLVSARNAGVDQAIGDYICPVDADDWIHKDYIKSLKWVLTEFHPSDSNEIDMIVFAHKTVHKDREETHIPIDSIGLIDRAHLESDVFPHIFSISTFLSAWSIVCRTDLLKAHLCKNEYIQMHEDFAYTYELFYNANNVYVLQKVLYYYNQMNTTSITHINGLSNNFLSRLRTVIYIFNNMKECERYIKNQLCSSLFLIMIYDFYEFNSMREVNEFRKSLTEEHRENIYVATAVVMAMITDDVPYHRTIWWASFLMLYGNFRMLYLLVRRSKRRFFRKLIY